MCTNFASFVQLTRKIPAAYAVIFGCLFFIFNVKAAPLVNTNIGGEDISENLLLADSPPVYPPPQDDGSAPQILGRHLGVTATCLVAGIEYTHGQQIYRADPCEFCLCLDGEMFCWWQECPPSASINPPCRDRYPFGEPCILTLDFPPFPPQPSPSIKHTSTQHHTATSTQRHSTSIPSTSTMTSSSIISSSSDNSTASSAADDVTTDQKMATSSDAAIVDVTSSTETPTVCVVMGREYNIGSVLPHDTGNCVECVCAPGARIACSPHGCSPPDDDGSVDYRSPGLRSDPGVFK